MNPSSRTEHEPDRYHIISNGGIWRLSPRQMRQLRADLAAGRERHLDEYGVLIVTNPIVLSDLRDECQLEHDAHD